MRQASVDDIYTNKYVAFLDILGFKKLVEIADQDCKKRRAVLDILELLRSSLCEDPAINMRLTHFSDCIILSANRTLEGLRQMFHSIDILTVNLLDQNVFLRGGFAAGGAHHDGSFVYGTAINKAYKLENDAIYPRTILSEEVVNDTKQYGLPFEEYLVQGEDDYWFIHYLKRYANYQQELYPGKVILDMPANRIAHFVGNRLVTDQDNILAKAQWFQRYWNTTVATTGVFSQIKAGFTELDSTSSPTIIVQRLVAGLPTMPPRF